MTVPTLIIVLLVLFLLGGVVPWQYGSPAPPVAAPLPGQPVPTPAPAPGYWHGYGYGPVLPGALGAIAIVLLILVVAGLI
jgi:hypothetical protein